MSNTQTWNKLVKVVANLPESYRIGAATEICSEFAWSFNQFIEGVRKLEEQYRALPEGGAR